MFIPFLGLEPGGCTNDPYIVRKDSMEPGNASFPDAKPDSGAPMAHIVWFLSAPKYLCTPSGLREQQVEKKRR